MTGNHCDIACVVPHINEQLLTAIEIMIFNLMYDIRSSASIYIFDIMTSLFHTTTDSLVYKLRGIVAWY